MKLCALGFNEWFVQRLNESDKTGYSLARITSVNKDTYLVMGENGEVLSELAGEFMFSAESRLQYPAVGDWAFIQYYNANTLAIIYDLLPRKTILRRKTAGKKIDYQIIASNIDVALIVQSCDFNFSIPRLERYLVMINDGHIEPVILLSKSDLVGQNDLERKVSEIKNTGIKCEIIAYSVETGAGLPQIQQVLKSGMTYCLLGSSGVGKTTLLNHLTGRDAFKINLVREKDGKGRHTTSRRQLIVLDQGAMLIDTPGMREMDPYGIRKEDLGHYFLDFLPFLNDCKFNTCTHFHEPDCAVVNGVEKELIFVERYESYLNLLETIEEDVNF